MPNIEYHLYRVKLVKPAQLALFHPEMTPRSIFEDVLSERPSLQFREGNVWHIGNIEQITPDGGRFAVGRTTKTTVEKFDSETGNFTELRDDSGPYTFVYFDSKIGLLGIGKRTKVAATVKSVARKLQKLFSRTRVVTEHGISVRVDLIPDPESFLEKLYGAYAVKRFKATFTGPNPIDADELFQKPMSYYCQQLEADEGSVIVKGESLDDDAVAAVAKSTAATGNTASALIQVEKGSRPIPISFKGDARRVVIDSEVEKAEALVMIQREYGEVRQ
ncbi:MAG: hypothetical protein JNN07_24510 [Verrucomicrobiales bacterium]|jgi:hypothetical protein|nr:hypothetical protein [Verrucomicrobiales bacterium]